MQSILKTKCLADTNILVYTHDKASSFHLKAVELISELAEKKSLFIAQQNIVEFTNVMQGVYKASVESVVDDSEKILTDLSVIVPTSTTVTLYLQLLKQITDNKKRGFDIFLAATMLDNGISHIVTANDRDFADIPGITAYNPWKEKGK